MNSADGGILRRLAGVKYSADLAVVLKSILVYLLKICVIEGKPNINITECIRITSGNRTKNMRFHSLALK